MLSPLFPKDTFHHFLQTEQMKRISNELDSVHFSLKKASQMVKEIGCHVQPLPPYRPSSSSLCLSIHSLCEGIIAGLNKILFSGGN
jgi:hypothetical protein